MSLKYYQFINTLVKIDFDDNDDASYCDLYDFSQKGFTRRNDMLDEVLNHHQTHEVDPQTFSSLLDDLEARVIKNTLA